MRVATDIWIGNEALAVAERAGAFDPAEIRRVEYSSNQEILRALRNGLIESAALLLDEALVAAHDGTDLVILAAVDASKGGDAIIGQPAMTSLADLKGRRVGVQLNSGGLQMLYRGLAEAGLVIGDVTVVNVPPDRHVRMFTTGEVDAVVTFEPMRTMLLDRGGVQVFDSSAFSQDIVNVLVARRDYLVANPERGRALASAWFAGAAEIVASDSTRQWVAHRQGLTSDQVQRALSTVDFYDAARSRALVSDTQSALVQTAHRFHHFMRQNGRLSRDIWV
ncbi:MAG TPA: ABC transporter substrate-binding protein, partial [Vicinamibacterales bacterium]|nr:ABC transporter substrate-binding protein [Vicinamibacterales bacterium]